MSGESLFCKAAQILCSVLGCPGACGRWISLLEEQKQFRT